MKTPDKKQDSSPNENIPLCVDLDGTFIRSDLLIESLLRFLRRHPLQSFKLPLWLLKGRANLKARLAASLPESASPPPVNRELAEWLASEQKRGRSIILVTASHRDALGPVLSLFPFDEIIATSGQTNLKGESKAALLAERFGEKGFDYAGDSRADEAVWRRARKAIVVHRSPARIAALSRKFDVVHSFSPDRTTWRDWARALRIHQWSKNLLIAVPFLAGHHFQSAWQLAGLFSAFLAMSLCASGTYLWNDLLDLEFDRAHSTKRHRLAASGRTTPERIALVSLFLTAAGLSGGFGLSFAFGLLLLGYIAATLSYSLFLKRIAIADIFLLAFLYMSRIVGGILISDAVVSFWLFAFTFLLFLSLAAAKRFTELRSTTNNKNQSLHGRGYRNEDIPAVSQLGMATGVASCILLGLYSHSEQVMSLYLRPQWFWGVCVVALYWITRLWFLAHRGELHDDPVVFALKDRVTWCLGLAGLACIFLASPVL